VLIGVKTDGAAQIGREQPDEEILGDFLRGPTQSEATLLHMDATANGRELVVSQKVRVLERLPDASYVWVLRVYRETPKVPGQRPSKTKRVPLVERYYTEQTFHVPADVVVMNPTFTESVVLEPGTYSVRVSLDRVRPGVDPTQLIREGLHGLDDGVTGGKTVTISD
jgi:hypothetical protein